MDYAAHDRNPTLPRSRARRRIHFSTKGVIRQLIPLVLYRGGSDPSIWFRLSIHIAPSARQLRFFERSISDQHLAVQRFHCYGLSYAREEDRSR
jgi:hypothetical protein